MIKLYIAGPYSSDNILGVLDNIRNGQRAATEAMIHGFAVFCPWLDYQLHLQIPEGEKLTVKDYQDCSMEWLTVSDGVLLLPGWERSKGTLKEMKTAEKLGIPIFKHLIEAINYFEMEGISNG